MSSFLSLLHRPAMDVLRSMCCWLCLQAGGGNRAGAVATVVAAVDLARVRQPLHVEEEAEADMATSRTTARAQASHLLTAAQFTPESTAPRPQVSQDFRIKFKLTQSI